MVICMRREVVIQNKDVIKKTIHCLSRRKSLLLRFLVPCWYNWCQTAWPPQQHLTLVFGNWVEAGGDGEDEAGEEQSVPHDPHPGPICRTYGQQEFSVYKFVPPPTHQYPPSSFFQTICTKDPDKGAQSPPRMSARVRKLLLHAKECVCALNENISFVRFLTRGRTDLREIFTTHHATNLWCQKASTLWSQPSKINPADVKRRTKHRMWKIKDLLVWCFCLALWLIYKALV